jgi:hypothetical protein
MVAELADIEATGAPVPYAEYRRLLDALQQSQRAEREAQHKLSAVAAALQNPGLTWKQRGARIAVVFALEAQRPEEDAQAPFRVDLGDLAKRAGLIPPTPDGDEDLRSKGWKAGRKLAGQVIKELADVGAIDGRILDIERDPGGTVKESSVVIRIEQSHVDVLRAVSQVGGSRKLQRPRGVHTKIDPRCPACGSSATTLECHACGVTTPTEAILERMNQGVVDGPPAGFQRLETHNTETRGERGEQPGFQRLETGAEPEPEPDPVEFLCAIAGTDAQHVEMRPAGGAKYLTVNGPVTPELARRHIAGEVMVGTTLRHGDETRALCWEADSPDGARALAAAAIELTASGARPLLSDSPSRDHPGGRHLWLAFDQLVDTAAAVATAERHAPALATLEERWPCNKRVRLPAGFYRRPGAEGWCALWVPGGVHRTGPKAFDLLCRESTQAAWVTERPQPPPAPPRRRVSAARRGWLPPTRPILNGHRDESLRDFAAAMAGQAGMSETDIFEELCRIRDELCEDVPGDRITDASLRAKAGSAVRKYGGRRDG